MTVIEFLKTFFDDFKKLKLKSKVAVTLIGLVLWISASAVLYPEAAASRGQYFANWFRAATGSENHSIPLSSATRKKFRELERSIEAGLVDEIDERLSRSVTKIQALDERTFNSWTLSQIAIALPYEAEKHRAEFLARFDYWKHPEGVGWAEFPDDPEIKIPVLAWTLLAKASIFHVVDEENVKYLLAQQDDDGWWGVYSDTKHARHASVYATAMSAIALSYSAEELGSIDDDARDSLRKASDWLRVKRNERPLWFDYPNNNGTLRPALSGLVLYALFVSDNILGQERSIELIGFCRDYLRNLPSENVPLEFSEVSGLNVARNNIDHVRIYFYPSVIAGVVTAYKFGSLRDRAAALLWLDSIADHVLKARNIYSKYPWIAAEYLISVKSLLRTVGQNELAATGRPANIKALLV